MRAWSWYSDLDRTQWHDPAAIERSQLERLRALCALPSRSPITGTCSRSRGRVPEAIETMDDLQKIPLLTCRVYQEHTEHFLAEELPPGTYLGGVSETSGSSVVPTKVYHTGRVNTLWWRFT